MARTNLFSLGLLVAGLGLSGCASTPQKTLGVLAMDDPLYDSPACLQARNIALGYDDKTLSRAGMGLGLGLLGPVGVLGAVAIDANQNGKRQDINAEIQRRCSTPGFKPPGGDPAALADRKACRTNSAGAIECT